ncbi:Methyltransferase domain-containing protein [Micromonospora nigra]|uniref:Methyltransferase domain-containing protein n=1 Tax=Micromonospora nigra TaxID=145857 RepID=A0A1C6RHE2_9ACTN|nr:class I SAM-dependent methyltransferase [Micromonospora nigra]SCL16581.1 Methyltransferase domain-containing protein [Micromonospora nigra]
MRHDGETAPRTHRQPTQDRPAGVDDETARFWDDLYGQRERRWSGRANPHLVDVAGPLPAGTVLDLGCGEGGDAVWLARQGWRVTAVDVSATALDRAGAAVAAAGVAARVEFQRHDLTRTFPTGTYDLVSAQFLQSPLEFPRLEVLRAAARAVAPGGRLLVVEHGEVPPWARAAHPDVQFPTPQETLAGLDLEPGRWETERLDAPRRTATGPDGQPGHLVDHLVLVRRR